MFPRLVAAEHSRDARPTTCVSTGVAELDELMGGGLAHGSNTLFAGPVGRGQDHHGDRLRAGGAASAASKAAYYLFDEGLSTLLIARARARAWTSTPYIDSGQLRVVPLDPAEVSAGEFAHMVRARGRGATARHGRASTA